MSISDSAFSTSDAQGDAVEDQTSKVWLLTILIVGSLLCFFLINLISAIVHDIYIQVLKRQFKWLLQDRRRDIVDKIAKICTFKPSSNQGHVLLIVKSGSTAVSVDDSAD